MKNILNGITIMKTNVKNVLSVSVVTVLLCLALTSGANALFIESIVGETGIEMEYDINQRLKGEVTITPEDPWEINIFDLIVIQLSITDIDPNPPLGSPVVNLHYHFKSSYPYEAEFENDFSLPFGELGIETDRSNRNFVPIEESNQIDISILSTANKFQYAINLNFGEIFSDRWEGESTFREAKITEEVIINTEALADFLPGDDFPSGIPQEMRWDITLIPVFTISSFNLGLVKIDTFHDGSLISSIPADIPSLGEFLSMFPYYCKRGICISGLIPEFFNNKEHLVKKGP